jgi:hypothetical protein
LRMIRAVTDGRKRGFALKGKPSKTRIRTGRYGKQG